MAADDTVLGTTTSGLSLDAPVTLSHDDRRRHLHVIGKTGTGKTTLLLSLMQADLESGSVTCSDEVLELLGLAPSDATGERLLGLINPEDVSTVLAARDRALSSANECAVEFRVRRADGTPAWFEVRLKAHSIPTAASSDTTVSPTAAGSDWKG